MGSAASIQEELALEDFNAINEEYSRLKAQDKPDEEIFNSIRDLVLNSIKDTSADESAGRQVAKHQDDASVSSAVLNNNAHYQQEDVSDDPDDGKTVDDGQLEISPEVLAYHQVVQHVYEDDEAITHDSKVMEKLMNVDETLLPPLEMSLRPPADDPEDETASLGDDGDVMAAVGRNAMTNSRSTFDLTQNLTPVFTTDVLTDPATLKLCLEYVERHKIPSGSDLLKFWVEIDELQLLPSHSYTHRRLRKIYDKFLSVEAPSPVCVTDTMLRDIETALETDNISAGMYVEAQAVCFVALDRSVYPRFRESKLFRKMQDFCAPINPQTAPPEDYSLLAILDHPAKLRFLKTFCMEALALENLLFYLEVEDCKRLPNLSFISSRTKKIYDRYCCPTSRNYIHVDQTVLRELHATVERGGVLIPKMFYEAQVVTFGRISDEIWRGFCRTHEYLEHSRQIKPVRKRLQRPNRKTGTQDENDEMAQRKLDAMNEFQLIETAMHYPVEKLIPSRPHADDAELSPSQLAQSTEDVLSPQEMLATILGDSFAKRYFKQFMKKRGMDQFLAFCEEVEDFKLLPGIEYLQHTARKIYRKYMMPSAKLQVDMSTTMRDEIAERLHNPSVDMFKKISARVRHGMLQDSLPRFVKANHYSELKRKVRASPLENELKLIDQAAKKGKLESSHLEILLQNQVCMRQFKLFLEMQHCSENLMLWEEIEHYRRLPSYQIVLRSAKKIYDKYLNPVNTRMMISMPDAMHRRVVEQLDVASRCTFDEIESECHEVMRNVAVPDFLDSRIFMALVGTWAIVDDEYPSEMLRGEFEMAFLRHRFHLVQETKGLSRDTSTPKLDYKRTGGVAT